MFDVVLFLVSLALVGSSSKFVGNDTFFLGQSIYVPNTDLLGSVPNGIHPFSLIQEHCIQNQSLHKSVRNTNYFRDTEALYGSIATTIGLQGNFETDFSFGFTLDATTKSISGAKRDVSGLSLELKEKAYILLLSKDCLLQATPSPQFMYNFQSLSSKISKPWLAESWREYLIFLKKWGSHIITGVTLGSSIVEYSFAEETQKYTERDFTVKSCVSLAGSLDPKKMNVSACSNIAQKEIENVSHMEMSSSLSVTGGTAETRTQLLYNRSAELIEQFMREGETHPALIEYNLVPIWEYLQEKSVGTLDLIKAVNMEYFYNGFLNFDCPYNVSHGMDLQKFDLTDEATPEHPEYSCTIAPSGCQSYDDCHYHIGVWCNCAGDTCIHYHTVTSDTGKTRLQAAPYYRSGWGWQGCDWKVWGSVCDCKHPSSERKTIWSQSSKYALYLASVQSLKEKQESLIATTRNEL
ncbi:DELTA-thalatoxin-Avl2a-like [Acropora millepora]|uniref:DELTA-thalatoxin-Avl2a-like n=1 Tax=Acropora millepora TaxID=45264 RepID=UPI001CF43524|nr:DELTA-thalatoxin-Avl2a-like [Acropora millepora]